MKLRYPEKRDVPIGLLDDNPVYPAQRLEAMADQPDDGGDTQVGSLQELDGIIRQTQIVVPFTVVQVSSRYVILNGHRRLRVARALGLDAVPCDVLTLEPGETVGEKTVVVADDQLHRVTRAGVRPARRSTRST